MTTSQAGSNSRVNVESDDKTPGSHGGLVLVCKRVSPFETSNLECVRGAFRDVMPCPLRQCWQPEASPAFAPASVYTAWVGRALFVYAELVDADIHTQATGLNQRLWELGDAFEMFLGVQGEESYIEFQVAPNNQRLQLRYANRAAVEQARATGDMAHALIPGEAFHSRVWVQDDCSRWHVLATIPASAVCSANVPLVGSRWRFSFSRYDYTRGGGDPVISSTSPHAQADFHRQQEWGALHFRDHQ